ncbi:MULTISPECIES: thiolase family protein [Latilactobacillus]|uniref:thiolase family protein n=1 Tax=Latilactobacillus TaxID=2767885 RepID=UPI0020303BD4|nr:MULTISPECIES: thiolase family protein [Latilactobacillus]MCM1635767.1 thiolase family protein [Latilactobacillus sakei]MCW8780387.1 thiolase family protein [Latilactobacillus curvatus]
MKNRVAVIGTGMVDNPGISHPNRSFKQLLTESVYKAIDDAGILATDIEGSSFSYTGEGEIGHGGISATLNDALALSPIPGFINCSNCASGHTAFMQGCDMIESGEYSVVLVAGFEKSTDVLPFFDYALISSDSMYDYNLGYSHIDAVLMQDEYFKNYNISDEKKKASLLAYAKYARKMGSKNPSAHFFGHSIPKDSQLEKMPLFGSFMKTGEGSAAIILASEDFAKTHTKSPVFVQGRSYITTSHYIGHRYDASLLNGIEDSDLENAGNGLPLTLACQKAYHQAGINASDIDTVGVYDQVTSEFVSLEATGICGEGEAPDFILSGKGDIDGEVPINTDGGNIGRGFAGGTAGIYPLIEIVKQLQGTARGYQIKRPIKYGLSTYLGGGFAHCVAVVMTNE